MTCSLKGKHRECSEGLRRPCPVAECPMAPTRSVYTGASLVLFEAYRAEYERPHGQGGPLWIGVVNQLRGHGYDITPASFADVIRVCGQTFREYEQNHREKNTPDGNRKAERNAAMAKLCEDALARHQGQTGAVSSTSHEEK